MAETVRIAAGAKVTLHFALSLTDGSEIDSNYDKSPASFRVGDGSLLPGFEAALMGAAAGDSVAVLLPAADAFGEINPDNVQSFPRQRFAGLLANTTDPIEPGTVLSFADSGGNEIPGVIKQIGELSVVIDFNHPLAGREIMFRADIISVIPAGTQTVRLSG
ncbi:MAG: peptidylprolyl isomerase [Gammaproteobacteria bacterium]|nr:peptidylprolyl isomerase [Gammaproteobacteria bacterium]